MIRFDRMLIRTSDAFFWTLDRTFATFGRITVSRISTAELRSLQREQSDAEGNQSFILVDVRSEAEYSVSLIPGAITKSQYQENDTEYKDKIVIPYCTVGGRSYMYARKLAKRGVRARNYQASILGWCDERLPLVTHTGQATNRVHVYSKLFRVPKDYDAVD